MDARELLGTGAQAAKLAQPSNGAFYLPAGLAEAGLHKLGFARGRTALAADRRMAIQQW